MICHNPYQNSWDTYAKARQNKALSLGERGKAGKGSYNNIPKLLWSRRRIRVNLVNCVFAPNFLKFPKMFWTGFKSYAVSQKDTMAKILIHPKAVLWCYTDSCFPSSHCSRQLSLKNIEKYHAEFLFVQDVHLQARGKKHGCNFTSGSKERRLVLSLSPPQRFPLRFQYM